MVKNYQFQLIGKNSLFSRMLAKIFLIMKLSFILFFLSVNVALASNTYAQNTVLSLDMSNKQVSEVLDEIERLSEFRFYYNSKLVDTNRKVTVNVRQSDVFVILNQLFASTNIGYKVVDKDVILLDKYTNGGSPGADAALQVITIAGTVTEENGEPLPGVNVIVKGTTTGIMTDVNGNYSITAPNTDAVLAFSYIGYHMQEIWEIAPVKSFLARVP